MTDFLMDRQGDWVVKNGSLVILNGKDRYEIAQEIAQSHFQRLSIFYGEWYQDRTIGVPWHEVIFQKASSAEEREAILKREILAVPGEYSLGSFNLRLDDKTRKLSLTYEIIVAEVVTPVEVSLDLFSLGGGGWFNVGPVR